MYVASSILIIVGTLLFICGILIPIILPSLMESKFSEKLTIAEGSDYTKSFRKSAVPVYVKIRFFNITNPKEVEIGEKPILKELGPYVYRQERERIDLTWDNNLGTVGFKDRKYFYFEPSMSNGLESDVITTINPLLVFTSSKVDNKDTNPGLRAVVQLIQTRFEMEPLVSKTVHELTYGGYEEPLIKQLYILLQSPAHKEGKFGFFYPKNGTIGKEIHIFSGVLSMENYQQIYTYDGMTDLSYWKTDTCNMINGSDGTAFPRPLSKDSFIYIFSGDLCRSLFLKFEKVVHHGPLPLYRYILPKEALVDKCFCTSDFECRDVMINVAPCKKGVPVIMSTPHFYMGEVSDQSMVEGLNPNKNDHETYLDIEPYTGMTLRVSKRIQVSMPLRRYANLPMLRNVSEVIMPILWVDETAQAPIERAELLHKTLSLTDNLVRYGSWVLIFLGIIMFITGLILICLTYKKRTEKRYRENVDKVTSGKLLGSNYKN